MSKLKMLIWFRKINWGATEETGILLIQNYKTTNMKFDFVAAFSIYSTNILLNCA